jgi:DNA-binding response OmpR family regulator
MALKILLITVLSNFGRLRGIEFSVLEHTSAKDWMSTAHLEGFDLILLDISEDESGSLELCRQLCAEYGIPILILTRGNDEYFLLIRSGIKVQKDKAMGLLEAYGFRLRSVKSGGELITPQETLVRLSQLEARLLHLLIVNSGCVVASDLIIQRVWPDKDICDGDRHLLKALVHRLRRKIEADPTHPQYIQTIPHQGYSFRPQ